MWETDDLEGIFFGAELDGDVGVGNAVLGRDGEGLDGSFGGFDELCGSGHFGRGSWVAGSNYCVLFFSLSVSWDNS